MARLLTSAQNRKKPAAPVIIPSGPAEPTAGPLPEEIPRYLELSRPFVESTLEYPEDRFKGRGIVCCAGGRKYFTCAWVMVHMLRRSGCDLPVEFWYLGEEEMDEHMKEMVAPLNVTCIDAFEVRKKFPARRLSGWECNPYSIMNSSFEEVIFLDADNVPLINPETLFDTPQYKETGAIFWPDYGRLAPTREIWKICGVQYRDEPEFESGQIVIDKRRCWNELALTMHINEHSDFYYKHIHGDKDTFHMAWRMRGKEYSMPDKPIYPLRATMCQHDFAGARIFQHRNLLKWTMDSNERISGFQQEEMCLAYVNDLRRVWSGVVNMPMPTTEEGKELYKAVVAQRDYWYDRVGLDRRIIEFLPNGTIGRGAADMERAWYIKDADGPPTLHVAGDTLTFTATVDEMDLFHGNWVSHERCPVILLPVGTEFEDRPDPTLQRRMENKRFIYVRVELDKRVLEFLPNNVIGNGAADLEKTWGIHFKKGIPVLVIGPDTQHPICELILSRDGIWRGRWNKYEKMHIQVIEIP